MKKRICFVLAMLMIVGLVATIPVSAASGKGAVTKWLGLLPNNKIILQNRVGALCYVYGSTWSYGVEFGSHVVILGDLDVRGETSQTHSNYVLTYTTITVARITTAILDLNETTTGKTTNDTVTYSTTTVAKIATANITKSITTDATVTNSTTTVDKIATAIIARGEVTNEVVTYSTTTVGVITTANITKSITANATVTNSTTTVGVITTLNVGKIIPSLGMYESYAVLDDSDTLTINSPKVNFCSKATPMEVTLPAVADCPGLVFTFIKTNAAAEVVLLNGNASEEIDGSATNSDMDAQYDSLTIVSDGTEWFITQSLIN